MNINNLNVHLKNYNAQEILKYFMDEYEDKIALSSSFGAEDQVLTDMIINIDKNANIFTLDTGRLNTQTYDLMDVTNLKYKINVNVYFPNNQNVENLYKKQGINGHFESIKNRKNCCNVRKVEPLKRALKSIKVWVTGLRSSQNITRENMSIVEFNEEFDVLKINPLLNYSEEDVWEYIKKNNVPYNKLHDQNYPSIGCAPCTRAVKIGEDARSGRWWWENPKNKECGLHIK